MTFRKKARASRGIVYLVGAGPGDPGLLTLRGAAVLQKADAVVYDALANPSLLDWAPQGAEKIYVGKNIHRKGGGGYIEQGKIHNLLDRLSRAGKNVVRLKGGDPFVFGRGGEEALYLKKHGIRFEVVPGVSAGIAAPAYAGIPVTDRRHASLVVFMTAHPHDAARLNRIPWKELAKIEGTLVLFMGMRNLKEVMRLLKEAGKAANTPVSVIEGGTLPSQRIVEGNLATIAAKVRQAGIRSPAVIVIGEVNRFRKDLAWYPRGRLSKKTVVVTRAQTQASQLKEMLEKEGASVLEIPSIRILPPKSWKNLDRALKQLTNFDWIFFTSANGVASVLDRLKALGKDLRSLGPCRIAAVGERTAACLSDRGLHADFVPRRFTTEALFEGFRKKFGVAGKRFLLPRTGIAPDFLRHQLKKFGGQVTEVIAYRTLGEKNRGLHKSLRQSLDAGKVDFVTFTSASTARNFFHLLPPKDRKKLRGRCVSIGPVTSRELRRFGVRPAKEARRHTLEGLVSALTNGTE